MYYRDYQFINVIKYSLKSKLKTIKIIYNKFSIYVTNDIFETIIFQILVARYFENKYRKLLTATVVYLQL